MKRICDIAIVLLTAVLWAPLMAGVAVAVLVEIGRPVLFTQLRPGLRGRPFRLPSSLVDQ